MPCRAPGMVRRHRGRGTLGQGASTGRDGEASEQTAGWLARIMSVGSEAGAVPSCLVPGPGAVSTGG